ncbi:hypothetical protein [Amycolatopsis tolypomycina]|uniref:hypothetical protein n=1 Tax=Amycolatopsis tolypomycina TaxID=208445 RepID=UPI0033B18D26
MRRITVAALTAGVLFGTTAGLAQAESGPTGRCVGSSLAMYATTQLCVVERTYPAITQPGS